MSAEEAEEERQVREPDLPSHLRDGDVARDKQFLRATDTVAVEPVKRG